MSTCNPPDVNDRLQEGADPSHLAEVGEARDPVLTSDRQRALAADAGVRLLEKAHETLADAQALDPEDKREAVVGAFAYLMGPEQAALLAAAWRVRAPDYSAVMLRIKGLRGCGGPGADLDRAVRQTAKAQERDEAQDRGRRGRHGAKSGALEKMLRALKVEHPGKWRMPPGWEISEMGLVRVRERQGQEEVVHVAHEPLLLVGKTRDLAAGEVFVELAWRRPGGGAWVRQLVPRAAVRDSRRLLGLDLPDGPVSSANSADMVSWLAGLEATNASRLGGGLSSQRLGWLGREGQHGFLLGARHIAGPEAPQVELAGDPEDIARLMGWAPRGTIEGWLAAVEEHATGRPRALLAIYTSLAAPLLLPLGLDQGFVVAWDGASGGGKSSTLKLGASVFGDPRKRAQVVESWHKTKVDIERLAATLRHLPPYLDETQECPYKNVVADMLYVLPNGSGKGRGKREEGKRQAIKTWLTVAHSTGELPATSFREDGGGAARVLSIRGRPFDMPGASVGDSRRASQGLMRALAEHHGHLGPLFVEGLVAERERDGWASLREVYHDAVEELSAGYSGVTAQRICSYTAVIAVVEHVLHDVMGLPRWCRRDDLWEVLDEAVLLGDRDSDKALRALEEVWSWACANEARFCGRSTREPAGGWAGRWDKTDASGPWEWVGFRARVLAQVLEEAGHSLAAVEDAWKARGWLVTKTFRREGRVYERTRINKRVGGGTARLVLIRRAAIEALSPQTAEE